MVEEVETAGQQLQLLQSGGGQLLASQTAAERVEELAGLPRGRLAGYNELK